MGFPRLLKAAAWRTAIVLLTAVLVLAGTVAAQDGADPAAVVAQLAADGIIDSDAGELVASSASEVLDFAGQPDARALWTFPLDDTAHTTYIMGATISSADPQHDTCGVVLHRQGNIYNRVTFKPGGILEFAALEQETLVDSSTKLSPDIAIGPGAANTLVLAVDGDTIVALVNGAPLGVFSSPVASSGAVGLIAMRGTGESDPVCAFTDVWLWSQDGAESPPAQNNGDDDSSAPAQGQPAAATLTRYDEGINAAVDELETLGVIPSGGSEIFREPLAYFEGTGNWYTALASYKPFTHIVMAGTLNFRPSDSGESEVCSLLARTVNTGTQATSYTQVGISNEGVLLLIDIADQEMITGQIGAANLAFDEPQHIIVLLMRDTATVYLNGERVLHNVPISERAGTYGVALQAQGAGARCEGADIWAWEVENVVAFGTDCGVRAGNTVNLRAGPGTNYDIAGQLEAGATALIVGQTNAPDGFVWYKLDNDAWVRSDVVSQGGDCGDIPTVTP